MLRSTVPALALLALLPACNLPPPPPNRFIEVSSTPPGAACDAVRSGKPVGRLEATPATLAVVDASAPITLVCTAPGYVPTSTVIETQINAGRTAAYLLLGGVGAALASQSTGDARRYPPTASLVLLPDHYPSTAARDAAFTAKREEYARYYQARLEETRGTCAPNDPAWCRTQVEPVEAERDAMMQRLDEQQRSVRIEG